MPLITQTPLISGFEDSRVILMPDCRSCCILTERKLSAIVDEPTSVAIEARQSILKLTGKATCHCCFVDSVLIHCLSAYGIPISIFGGAVADDG